MDGLGGDSERAVQVRAEVERLAGLASSLQRYASIHAPDVDYSGSSLIVH